ncbi:phosphodiester glycosidase family protein [cf. Phormidesmis sp. LEGE 11477]|uniref:phosphodiester glycosidase family protein n=1 Tax=cf. Phormidesmis sp. LEGE 11477 TaxID=1828680 RepID=UPI00187E1711|nr:phosphodiester glycosidase family protein [cf. Phormidesmis sp. LEGE 11477]MBE9061940.1 phosphodiester glycosidase family protein [cf. Phormidesmis sp. LEGE 11477]
MPRSQKWKEVFIWIGLLLPLALYGYWVMTRPKREPINRQPLFEGITYSRYVRQQPRPQLIHLLEIDLAASGIVPFVTPGIDAASLEAAEEPTSSSIQQYESVQQYETIAQKTSSFLEMYGLQLAVNANFFNPFAETTPWQYSPREGEPGNLIGLAISEGEIVSPGNQNYPALCFLGGRAEIRDDGVCPSDTRQAVAGLRLNLETRPPQDSETFYKFYPVCVAALDAAGTTLWLLLVDGKQPLYSEGMTRPEVADFLQALGAQSAVQLDGGGSTTLAIESDDDPDVINGIIHAKIPGNERPVANHLGFFANPLRSD